MGDAKIIDKAKRRYLGVSYILVVFISGYIGITQWIINVQLYKDTDLSFLIGNPVLKTDDNNLFMKFSIDARVIEFRFEDQVDTITSDTYVLNKGGNAVEEVALYKTSLSSNKKWIRLDVVDGEKIVNKRLRVGFNNYDDSIPKSRYFIDAIRIDNNNVEVYDFIDNYINNKNTNLALHIPLTFSNISTSIANNFGNKIIELIKFILIVLFSTQALLYLIGFVWKPKEISSYISSTNPDNEASVVDYFSRQYAIPLGFLGTVLSIWTALEIRQQGFTDFNSVLEIFKGGIFTTVLGLGTNILCLLRSNSIKITKTVKETKSED